MMRYNLTYLTLMQQWNRANSLERENVFQDSIIALYSKETGVFKNDLNLMKQNFSIQKEINSECLPKLSECSESLVIYTGRAKRRGVKLAIGIPASLLIGYGVGKFVTFK